MENMWIRMFKLAGNIWFLDLKHNMSISIDDSYNFKLELANDLVRNSSGLFVNGCSGGDENDYDEDDDDDYDDDDENNEDENDDDLLNK